MSITPATSFVLTSAVLNIDPGPPNPSNNNDSSTNPPTSVCSDLSPLSQSLLDNLCREAGINSELLKRSNTVPATLARNEDDSFPKNLNHTSIPNNSTESPMDIDE